MVVKGSIHEKLLFFWFRKDLKTTSFQIPTCLILCSSVKPDHTSVLHIYIMYLINGQYQQKSSRSPERPSIHQSGDNATITIQGSYNDVGGNQNITNITNIGGTLWLIQSKQNLTR